MTDLFLIAVIVLVFLLLWHDRNSGSNTLKYCFAIVIIGGCSIALTYRHWEWISGVLL